MLKRFFNHNLTGFLHFQMRQFLGVTLIALTILIAGGGLEKEGQAAFLINTDILLPACFLYLIVENIHNKLLLLLLLANAPQPAHGCYSAIIRLVRGTATVGDDIARAGAAVGRNADDGLQIIAGSTVRGTGMDAVKKMPGKIFKKLFDWNAAQTKDPPEMGELAGHLAKLDDTAEVDDFVKKVVADASERVSKNGGDLVTSEVIAKLTGHFKRKEILSTVDELLEISIDNIKFMPSKDLPKLTKYADDVLEQLELTSKSVLSLENPSLANYVRQACVEITKEVGEKFSANFDDVLDVIARNKQHITSSGTAFPKYLEELTEETRNLIVTLKKTLQNSDSSVEQIVSQYKKIGNQIKHVRGVLEDPRLLPFMNLGKVTDDAIAATGKTAKEVLKEATGRQKGSYLARQLKKFSDLSAKKKFLAAAGLVTTSFGAYGTGKTIYDNVKPSPSDKRESSSSSSSSLDRDRDRDHEEYYAPELELEEKKSKKKKDKESKGKKLKKQKNSTNTETTSDSVDYNEEDWGDYEETRARRMTTEDQEERVDFNGTHEIHYSDSVAWLVIRRPSEEVKKFFTI